MKVSSMSLTMIGISVFSGSVAKQGRTFEPCVFILGYCWVLARICKSYAECEVEPWTSKTAW